MQKKIKEMFLNNLGIKVIGILLAVFLWLVLNNLQDPYVTSSVTVPIEYDETYIEDNSLVAITKPSTVTIPVTVRKSKLKKISPNDFQVTVDTSEIIGEVKDAPESTKVVVEIVKNSTATYIDKWNYPQSQNYIKMVIDKVKTATYTVLFNTINDPPEGYQIGQLISDPRRVTVSGPTSEFSNLASVKATVDFSKLNEETSSFEAPLALYDGNGRVLTNTNLKLSQESVEVTAGLNQSKEISISIASYRGTPAEGYQVSKIDYSPKIIDICGSKNALANISTLTIPETELDISGADSKKTFDVNIIKYLPDDISLADSQDGHIKVTIEMEQLESNDYKISTKGFYFVNTNDEYEYTILSDTADISLSAFGEDFYSFDSIKDDITGTINVGGMTPNVYMSVPVTVDIDHAFKLNDEVTVAISIKEKQTAAPETQIEVSESETAALMESEGISEPETEIQTETQKESVLDAG